jgi:hypothetical protein
MRNPSIHIKESDLKFLIEKYGTDVKKIVKYAKNLSCNNRNALITNQQLEKKIERTLQVSPKDPVLFNNTLFAVRQGLRHRGFRKVEENSKDWLLVKDITSLANDFCETYNLSKKQGYKEYCQIGISKMTKFSYPKLKSMYDSICAHYQAIEEINNDEEPFLTSKIHSYYCDIIYKRTGLVQKYDKKPDDYVYFILVQKECKKLRIKFEDYINSQFTGLEYRNGIPHPAQLIGDNALIRLNQYLYEKGKKVNTQDETKKSDKSNFLKNLKNNG